MKIFNKVKKLSCPSLLLLTVLFVAVVLVCGCLSFQKVNNVSEAANVPRFSCDLSAIKIYDTNGGNYTNGGVTVTVSPESLEYSELYAPPTPSDITTTFAGNKLTITTKSNNHFEACYADFTATVDVPAWYEYKVVYTLTSVIYRSNSAAPSGYGYYLFDFGSTTTGSSAGLTFQTTEVGASPENYLKQQYLNSTAGTSASDVYNLTVTYKNESNQKVTYTNNFGAFAYVRSTSSNLSYITYTMTASSAVTEKKLCVTKPKEDERQFTYIDADITYNPVGWDDDTMELTSDSDSRTQKNVGTYTIKVIPKNYPWDDGTTDPVEFEFTIGKADSIVNPQYTVPNPMYVNYGLPELSLAQGDTPGTISWDTGQFPSSTITKYTWTFTPDDPASYKPKTGEETLVYRELTPLRLRVAVPEGVKIYDRYDTLAYSSFSDYLKDCLSVYIVYTGGLESKSPLPNSDYTFLNLTDTSILVSSGSSETKTISVSSIGEGQLDGLMGEAEITVNKAEIENMYVNQVASPKTLKYPVTLDQIKDNYTVSLKWNFAERALRTDSKFISVAVKDGADIDVGINNLVFTYSNNGLTYTVEASCNIEKGDIDMSGITFSDKSVVYDGNDHGLEIVGTLPDGVTGVTYTSSGDNKSVGSHTITASFTVDTAHYNPVDDMTATLTITNSGWDMSGVKFEDLTVTYDGNEHTLTISGDLPDGRITVTYTVAGQTGISFTEAGTYEFTATFSNPDPANYADIPDMHATLTIEENPDMPTPPVEDPPVEDPPANNEPSFFERLIASHFPLWQVIVMAVSVLLTLIFMIKAIQYGNRAKKAKGEAKKISSKAYAALLPVFSTETVALGLSNQIWSIMAFALAGLALLMFVVALITRRSWKKAELAKETAAEDREERKHRADKEEREAEREEDRKERKELRELREQLALMSTQQTANAVQGSSADSIALIEAMRREMEERHREEMAALREEQSRRDEAMKAMLAGIMGSRQGNDDMIYGSLDDTDMLVQRVIAGLLPAVQQMIPEPTAYLSAPAYETSSQNLDDLAQMVADRINIPTAVAYDNSDEIRALTDEVKDLKKQLSKGGKAESSVDVEDIVQKVTSQITPSSTTVIQGASAEELQALNAQIAQMQRQMDQMAYLSADELDDEDFDDDEEEWDSILDEDDDDNFVESVIIEADGTVRKVSPNFRMRLKESSEKNREWYAAIKNLFCSQKGVTYRVCKRVEKIRHQGQVIAVIGIAKRSIKLWLALKPYEYDARRYHHRDVSDKPRFVDVPLYVRVGSDRALTRAQELILALFQEQAMEARKRYNDRSIQELIFTLKHNRLLTNKQNKQLLCEVMHVHDCDVLDNETAEKCIETKNVDFIDDSVIEAVKLDDIDANFQDGNRVTLDKLRKAGLVSEECTGYTVTAGQRLTKPLIIVANDFTMEAIKMIVLTGGRVIRISKV